MDGLLPNLHGAFEDTISPIWCIHKKSVLHLLPNRITLRRIRLAPLVQPIVCKQGVAYQLLGLRAHFKANRHDLRVRTQSLKCHTHIATYHDSSGLTQGWRCHVSAPPLTGKLKRS